MKSARVNTTLASSVLIIDRGGEPKELLLRGIQSRFELSGGAVIRFPSVLVKNDLDLIAMVAEAVFNGNEKNTLYVLPDIEAAFKAPGARFELRYHLETITRLGTAHGVFVAAGTPVLNPALFGTTFDLATKVTIRFNRQASALLDTLTNRQLIAA